jgi:hypothetical protein
LRPRDGDHALDHDLVEEVDMRKIVIPIAVAVVTAAVTLLASPAQTAQGTVKWFNGEKGFGFITPDGGATCSHLGRALRQAIASASRVIGQQRRRGR